MVVLSFVKRWCNTLTLAEKATPCLFLWVFMDFCAYVRTYGASPLAGRGVRRDLANCPRSFFSPLAPEGSKKEEVNSPVSEEMLAGNSTMLERNCWIDCAIPCEHRIIWNL